MYEINICHLYPDLLNLYGDRGNIMALKKRCEWRDIQVNVSNVSLGDEFLPENYDIIFLGGGQDYEQQIIQNDLLIEKASEIKNAIKNDKVFLCICGGYQVLGNYYKTHDGIEIKFLEAIDFYTIGGQKRLIGNNVFECDFLKSNEFDGQIVGFENHSGKTYLGQDTKPLGKIIVGFGNNGEDGYEGVHYKNVFCSYSHGSLLPKNPVLSDFLLSTALKQKYNEFDFLKPIDDTLESIAHDSVLQRSLAQKRN